MGISDIIFFLLLIEEGEVSDGIRLLYLVVLRCRCNTMIM